MSSAPPVESPPAATGGCWSWLWLLFRWLFYLALFAFLALNLFLLSLSFRNVRLSVLDWAGATIEESAGVRMTARDFELRFWSGRLTIDGLVLSLPASQSRPFLTIPWTRTKLSWWSMLGQRKVVYQLHLASPRLDLGAPLPELPDDDGEAEQSTASIDLHELELTGGVILSGDLPADVEPWLDSLRAEIVRLAGSYRSDRLEMRVEPARLVVASRRRPTITAGLIADVAGDRERIAVDTLAVDADGLSLEANGAFEPATDGSADVAFQLAAEPARLFPDLTSGGRVDAAGEMALAGGVLAGTLDADVDGLPGEVLEPVLALAAIEQLSLAGTRLDAEADLVLDLVVGDSTTRARPDEISGHGTVEWRRQDELLTTASLTFLDPEDAAPGAFGLSFAAEMLPASAGQRRLAGELRAPTWQAVADGTLTGGRLTLELPDLEAAARRLGFDAESLGFQPVGGLHATAAAEGPLESPMVELDGAWSWDGEPFARFSVSSLEGVGPELPVHLRLAAGVLPERPGRRHLTADLFADDARQLGAGWLRDARFALELPDLEGAVADLRRCWRRLLPGSELPELLAAEADGQGLLTGELTLTGRGTGPLAAPVVELSADWRPAANEGVTVSARGDASMAEPWFDGEARLAIESLEIARFAAAAEVEAAELSGRIGGSLDFDGTYAAHRATLELAGAGLRAGDTAVDDLRLVAHSDGTVLELRTIEGVLGPQPFSGSGRLERGQTPQEDFFHTGQVRLELPRPLETLELAAASIRLADRALEAEISWREVGAQLRPVARARATLAALSPEADRRQAWLGISGLDLEPLLPLIELPENAPRPAASIDGSLTLDLDDPLATAGTLEVSGLELRSEDVDLTVAEPLRFELADRRLELAEARLVAPAGGQELRLSGHFDLAPAWQPGDDEMELVEDFLLRLAGGLDTSILEPIIASALEGVEIRGVAEVDLEVSGQPAAPVADGRIHGPEVSLFTADPYPTHMQGLTVTFDSRPLTGTTDGRFETRLNRGDLVVAGSFAPETGLVADASLAGVRYRLDYGLSTVLGADLRFTQPPGGRGRLSGEVNLERGALKQDLPHGFRLVKHLLEPDMTSLEDTVTDDIDLDLAITTGSGVRIDNNLADLRADWNWLHVRGTPDNPLIAGRVELDPGGTVTSFGQILRLDEASLLFTGAPGAEPELVLDVTSSLTDPSLRWNGGRQASLGDGGPRGSSGDDAEVRVRQQLKEGLAVHFTDRLGATLTRRLSGTAITLEPLPIFGQADSQARLTVTQRLSPNADLVYSVNPRNAEAQTYLLGLHDFPPAPSLAAQLFDNDDDNVGLTLVHTLERGGGRSERAQRLGRLTIEAPDVISKRRLRWALDVRRGEPFAEHEDFELEIDARHELWRQGYPGAAVALAEQRGDRRVDLDVVVADPGPRVEFVFEGDTPSRITRRAIEQHYRVGAGEAASRERMRRETARALRAVGYFDPRVEVTMESRDGAGGPAESRIVRVRSDGGRKIDLRTLEFEGVAAEDAAVLASRFPSRLTRIELAAELPGADRFLLQALERLGYWQAGISTRQLSDDGRVLVVTLEPGPRRVLTRIEIRGIDREEATQLDRLVRSAGERRGRVEPGLSEGQPANTDRIAYAAVRIADDLRRRGFAEARVDPRLESVSAARPEEQVLTFEIDAGTRHRIAGVRFDELRGTDPAWAEAIAGLEQGGVFSERQLGEAGGRLSRTRLFRSVRAQTSPRLGFDDGEALGPGGETATTVIFEVEEEPRYLISLGGRLENGEGAGVVAEAVDRNFLGRGRILGLRGRYSGSDERSLRLFHAVPGVWGSKRSLEIFLEVEAGDIEETPVDSFEGWVQLSFPLGPRTASRIYLQHENLSIRGGEDAGARFVIPALGWQLSHDTRAREIGPQPASGWAVSLDLNATDKDLGSDVSAIGIYSQLKLNFSLGASTWAQSFHVGVQNSLEDTSIPFVKRLRAGGAHSVRGYQTDSLGPVEQGVALGGEAVLVVNQELHFPLRGDTLSGLVFFDAGNVWRSRHDFGTELAKSLGLGVRAATPVGPIRVDVAFPLDRREGEDSFKVYVGFGNIF